MKWCIAAMKDPLSTSFFFLSTYAAKITSVASKAQETSGAAGKTLSSSALMYGIDL